MPSPSAPGSSAWARAVFKVFLLAIAILLLYRRFSIHKAQLNLAPLTAPPFPCSPSDPGKRVAIIGAGSAGSSAAYYINRYTQGCPRVNITVYERNSYVGGRTTTVQTYDDDLYGEPVELGASVFVKVNHNLMHAVKKLGLSTQGFQSRVKFYGDDGDDKELSDTLGVFDGKSMVYTSPTDPTGGWWMLAKLLWQYGLAPIKTRNLMQDTVGRFLKMYKEPLFPFADLTAAVQGIGLVDTMAVTGKQYLQYNGVSEFFSNEIIQASTRVNYAQDLATIHGVETMVCMATDGAMSVNGGNWQIFDGMLRVSRAGVQLNTTVESIRRTEEGTLIVSTTHPDLASSDKDSSKVKDRNEASFDTVILASPYQFSKLTVSPPLAQPIQPIPYIRLHVTLFTSPFPLDPEVFGLPADSTAPRTILTTTREPPHEEPWFKSVSTLRRVRNPKTGIFEYLYKIFSPERVEPPQLFSLLQQPTGRGYPQPGEFPFDTVTWIYEKVWDSYPVEHPRVTFEQIKVPLEGDDGAHIWYTSGIEPFISTMETSSLMGANVGRLIVDEWREEAEARSSSKAPEDERVMSEL